MSRWFGSYSRMMYRQVFNKFNSECVNPVVLINVLVY
jgi:hypothetical protein